VDAEAIAREQRRQQATDALDSERERAVALQEAIELLVGELHGSSVDEAAFARMQPEEAQLVRAVLDPVHEVLEEGEEDEWLNFGDDAPEPEEQRDPRAEAEEELGRLEEELAESRRLQEALERYLEALDG
jgi:hypothetical protein